MKVFYKTSFLLVLISLISIHCIGQFSLSGELRFRGGLYHGYKILPTTSTDAVPYISQRTRLVADYQNVLITTRISIQDVRMWGGENVASKTGVWGDSTGIDLNEAWVKFKLGNSYFLTLGRQYFKYDDQRLLAWRNWNQFSMSYDAVKFSFLKNKWQFDLGLSWNNKQNLIYGKGLGTNNYYNDGWRIKSLNFAYLARKFKYLKVSFSLVSSVVQMPESDDVFNVKFTFGPYLKLTVDDFDFMANVFLQGGRDAFSRKVRAFMFSVNTAYTLNRFSLGAGIDYISGQDANNESADYQKINHAFDLLYGARFKFYGWMNQFGTLQNVTKNGGLIDIYPNIAFNVSKKCELKVFYHLFSLQNNIGNISGEYGKSLGSELDIMCVYNVRDYIQISGGYSHYFINNTINALKLGYHEEVVMEAGEAYWFWVMLTIKPTIFKKD